MIKENLCIPSEAMEIVPNSLRSIISIHETIHEVSLLTFSLKSFLKNFFQICHAFLCGSNEGFPLLDAVNGSRTFESILSLLVSFYFSFSFFPLTLTI